MKNILMYRITLFREKFSVYGMENILMFLLLCTVAIIFPKFLLVKVEHVYSLKFLLAILIYGIGVNSLFEKKDSKEIVLIRTFFNEIEADRYNYFMKVKRFLTYQGIFFYLLFPFKLSNLYVFWGVFLVFEVLTAITLIVARIKGCEFAQKIRAMIVVVGGIIIAKKDLIPINFSIYRSSFFFLLVGLLAFYCSWKIARMDLEVDANQHKKRLIKIGNIQNRDILYFVRTGRYVDPFVMLVLSAVSSFYFRENKVELWMAFLSSLLYLCSYIYIELLDYEKNAYFLLYEIGKINRLKLEKIANSLLISMPYIVLLFFVYGFHISVVNMVGCFIVAIAVFLMCALFFRFSYERKKGVNAIEDKEQLIFYLLIALLSIFIDVLVYYCDNLKYF